jgi:hypothetical protein
MTISRSPCDIMQRDFDLSMAYPSPDILIGFLLQRRRWFCLRSRVIGENCTRHKEDAQRSSPMAKNVQESYPVNGPPGGIREGLASSALRYLTRI